MAKKSNRLCDDHVVAPLNLALEGTVDDIVKKCSEDNDYKERFLESMLHLSKSNPGLEVFLKLYDRVVRVAIKRKQKLQQLREEFEELQSNFHTVSEQLVEKTDNITRLSNDNLYLTGRNDMLQNECNELTNERNELTNERNELTDQNAKLLNRCAELEGSLNTYQQSFDQQMSKVVEDHSALCQELTMVKQQHGELNETINILQSNLTDAINVANAWQSYATNLHDTCADHVSKAMEAANSVYNAPTPVKANTEPTRRSKRIRARQEA